MSIANLLNQKLAPEMVRQRKQGGVYVDYIDGWTAVENANRIFGYDGWEFSIRCLKEVLRETFENDKSKKTGYRVAYICEGTLRILVDVEGSFTDNPQVFTDVGYGSGVSYSEYGDAIESATKEAATDSLKRCLRFKGNQFGLALYDKTQRNVDSSMQNKLRQLAATKPDKANAIKSAIESFCKMNKAVNIDALSFEHCSELYGIIEELVSK